MIDKCFVPDAQGLIAHNGILFHHIYFLFSQGLQTSAVNINTHSISLDIDSIVPCSLVMQELISNSFKHAFPNSSEGIIDVSLEWSNGNCDNIELKISDNGIGLPADWSLPQTDTLGLQLVKRLSEDQLKGKINVDRLGGTSFTVNFPLKEDKNGSS
jgi:two-component sensor histidine kinase